MNVGILGLGLIGILSSIFPLAEATWINLSLIPLPVLFGIGLALFLVAMKLPNTQEKNEQEIQQTE